MFIFCIFSSLYLLLVLQVVMCVREAINLDLNILAFPEPDLKVGKFIIIRLIVWLEN